LISLRRREKNRCQAKFFPKRSYKNSQFFIQIISLSLAVDKLKLPMKLVQAAFTLAFVAVFASGEKLWIESEVLLKDVVLARKCAVEPTICVFDDAGSLEPSCLRPYINKLSCRNNRPFIVTDENGEKFICCLPEGENAH
jgi:hypothetical protein